MDTTPVRSLLTRLRAECRPLYQTGRIAPDLYVSIGNVLADLGGPVDLSPVKAPPMSWWVVVAHRAPTAYHTPECYTVEAATEADARALVTHRIGDLSGQMVYTYKVRPYEAPPAGRVL